MNRRLVSWLILPALALAAASYAQAPDRTQAEAQARRATERLRALQREADSLAAQEKTLLVELRQLEIDRDIQTEKLRQVGADLDAVAGQIGETTLRIDGLEVERAATEPVLRARLVELYKLGSGGYVRLLLGVGDLRQMGRAYRTAAAMAEQDRRRIEEYRQTAESLRTERTALERRRASMAALQQEGRSARTQLDRATRGRRALIDQIDERRDLNARLASELLGAQQRLQQTLAALGAGAPVDPVILPLRAFQHDLGWPAAGRVTARFGRPTGNGETSSSNGVEIGAPEGDAVRAVHEGTVAYAEPFTGYGNLVILDHGARSYSLYGHLAALEVAPGDHVASGEQLGSVGQTPTGDPVLYFELRIDGQPVDPVEWLRRR
jgi:septal ring factor EnvC (AmiA/AmiB activator)